jgi:hypothetical protein
MLSSYQRSRILIVTGLIVCLVVFWLGATYLRVPLLAHEAGALLVQPSPAKALLVTGVLFLASVVIGSAIAGTIQFEAGFFCAAFAMAALSMRAGPMRQTLFVASGPAIYVRLALEIAFLYLLLGIGWSIVSALVQTGVVRAAAPISPADETDEPIDQRLLGTLTQAVAMSILMMILCRSDDKAQALASVGVSALLATLAAHQFVPARPSAWFWTGPALVGLAGYIGTYFHPSGWNIGDVRGFFAPLARPLPIDYASFGTAGAILGCWTSRRWQRGRVQAELQANA